MTIRRILVALALLAGLAARALAAGTDESAAAAAERPKITFLRSHGNNPYAKEMKPDDDRYFKEVSRLSGYDFSMEFLDHANWTQLLSLRFASGDLPDAILTNSADSQYHPGAVQAGVFVDLTDLLPVHAPNVWAKMPPAYWKSPAVRVNGRIYGIPQLMPLPAWRVTFYRKDYLDALGMKPPVTLEDYLAVFAKAKVTDVNKNGVADEVPYGCRENFSYSDLPWGPFGVHPSTWRLRDGKLVPDIIAPRMREALEVWATMYKQGWVNYDMFTKNGTEWQKDVVTGKIMFWNHDAMNLPTSWSQDKFPKGAVLGVLPGPRDASGATPLAPENDGFNNVWVINAKTRSPASVLKFFNWMWSDDMEKEKFYTFGIKGYNFTEEGGKIVFDALAPQNIDKNAMGFVQTVLTVRGDYRMNPLIIDLYPNRDLIKEAISVAARSTFPHEGKNMPTLEAIKGSPSLGSGGGSLFMDMASRVITGKAEAAAAFPAFVAEWKRRGGDAAIAEATAWYEKNR